jgi:hypothetical protein
MIMTLKPTGRALAHAVLLMGTVTLLVGVPLLVPGGVEAQRPDSVALPPWALHPARLRTVANSAFSPLHDQGLEAPGRGVALSVQGGGRVRWGPLEGWVSPLLLVRHRQDQTPGQRAADAEGTPPPRVFQGGMDWPLAWAEGTDFSVRFPDTRLALHLGRGAQVAFSTERIHWGPSAHNALILSGIGEGFPHVMVRGDVGRGASEGRSTRPAAIEVEGVVGELQASPEFSTRPGVSRRQFVGFAVALRPPFTPGLTLGATGVQHRALNDTLSARDGLRALWMLPKSLVAPALDANLPGNGLGSVFVEWAHPESGLRLYGEFARDDHAEGLEDLILEPDHARAWSVGVEHTVIRARDGARDRDGARPLTVGAEYVDTRNPAGTLGRRAGALGVQFYTHGELREGHSHRGHLLGSPVGPGARTALLHLRLGAPEGDAAGTPLSIRLQHTEFGADRHRTTHAPTWGRTGRDLEWALVLSGPLPLDLKGEGWRQGVGPGQGTFGITRRENRGFHAFRAPGFRPADGVHVPSELNLHLSFEFTLGAGPSSAPLAPRPSPRRLGSR